MTVNPKAESGAAKTMAKDSDTDLPPGLETAWGLRGRPGKGPRPGLSVDRIVDAAVGLANAEGLPAVSMGRIAGALGVSTMSLYRYVSSKEELLVLMQDAAYGLPPAGPPPEEGWRAALAHWARAMREVLYGNLWMLRVPIASPPTTPRALAWMERGLVCLRDTALDEGEKIETILLVSGFVRSEATMTADIVSAARASGRTVEETMAAYSRLLARLADPERFPAVNEVLRAGVMTEEGAPDEEFAFGLERLLDGIEVLVAARDARDR
ncbi:TetR/AcrR family transcriptional regulator [Streptomyces sp. TRM 70361]|uniref:TetR/AcrR family transcriptional regulator n=1 Tax=Streptomyces sp. TRM 70361 TaxID=3116553 RepID=UPI002E7B7808|nr:TetR/AcrR family transcriptional regulator [Streptomyces sp. TRM 70361]MEE1940243.1 TetR/AcrR family transcriptional regulator [Streptomyces sp. TRM 70361]